jgi:hypothetical protein
MLAKRVFGDQRPQLRDQVRVATEREIDVDAEFDRGQPDLLEPGNGRLREVLVSEVGQRAAPPQRQGLANPGRRLTGTAAGQQGSPVVHQPLEPVQVEFVGSRTCSSPSHPATSCARLERHAQTRNVQPEGGAGGPGRVHAPDRVDKLLGPDDLVRVQEQHREQRAGLASGHCERPIVTAHLQWSQDPEFHLVRPPGFTGTRSSLADPACRKGPA